MFMSLVACVYVCLCMSVCVCGVCSEFTCVPSVGVNGCKIYMCIYMYLGNWRGVDLYV